MNYQSQYLRHIHNKIKPNLGLEFYMELWKRIGGAILGGIEGYALYMLIVFIGNQDLTEEISIVFVIIGAIIGFFAPIITIIGILLLFELLREANNRNNPRKGTFV